MAHDLAASYLRFLAGLVIGVILGIVTGLLTGRIRWVEAALGPVLNMWRALPPIALLPLVTLLAGVSDSARVSVIAFGTFFPVWIAAHTGAGQIPDRLLWAAQTLTHSRRRIWIEVVLPAAAGYILAGVRLAIGAGFTLVFVGELLGATAGLGYRVNIWSLAYRADSMLAALFVLGASSAITDWGVRYLARIWMPWLFLAETSAQEIAPAR